jgi:DNA-binding CsgD family transcriptional regulator
VSAMSKTGAIRWPLVGRAAELAVARDAFRRQQGAVVLGDAGTGKTRLARELLAELEQSPDAWFPVVGSRGAERVPLGAWSHLLPDTWEPAENDAATWRLLAAHLRRHDGEILLLVDDAHWLDPMSAALLHHLVATRQAKAIVTARRNEQLGQPMLAALWKDGYLARLDLHPFEYHETEVALEAALGDPVEPRTARRLHERSGGNVLMLRELVEAGRSDGSLRRAHGAWVQEVARRTSPRLVDLLADRIDDLDPEARVGAELLALGEPIPLALFSQIVDPAVFQRLASLQLVQVERAGRIRVVRSSHPLMAQVLVERMPVPHRDAVISSLIVAFEDSGLDLSSADVLRVALWRLDIGAAVAGDLALRGAELALARTDFPLAERLAREAVDGGQASLGTIVLGEALIGQQRHAAAERVLAPMHGDIATLDEAMRIRYAQVRALALGTELGRVDDAVAVLQTTLETLAAGPRRRMLEARIADLLADCGHFRAAAPLAHARIEAVEEDEVAALCSFVAEGLIRTLSGRCRDTIDLCDAMFPVALRHLADIPAGLGWIAAQRMLALYTLGELAAAAEFGTAIEALVVDEPDTTLRAGVLMFRGMVVADQGKLDEGLRLLQQAAALHELDNRRGYQAFCFGITARVHAQRGELVAAERALAEAHRHLWPGGQVFSSEIEAAAVWISVLRGDRTQAQRILDAALAHARDEGMVSVDAYLRHEAIRAGLDPAPHVATLRQLAADEQGRRTTICAGHAASLVAGDGDGLAEAARAFAALGHHLRAAEAFAQAAVCYRQAGSPGPAARTKALSQAQQQRCTGAATPALRDDDTVVSLTPRELDVATRAASGAANQDIASGLGISIRTVETHLQRAFDKLRVHRRSDLVALFTSR